MRFSLMCMGCVVALWTLQFAAADQPNGQHETAAAKEIAELKQAVAKLSSRMQILENAVKTRLVQQEPEIAQTGWLAPEPKKVDKPRLLTVPYKVGDLVEIRGDFAAAVQFDPLIRYIETHIAPEQWEANGGSGTLAPYRANLSLVVSTTPEVHEQISDWLVKMRAARQLLTEFEKAKFSALK